MPRIPLWTFLVLALLHLSAGFIDLMDVDASQYAEMSREMMHSGNWLHLYDRGSEYLDKPPFLFWVSAGSMKLFGVNNFGYKFPSIVFALWSLYATYRLARKLYDEETGRMAALILGTCQGMFLMTNDVRTDTILMSWVITTVWMIKESEGNRKWYYVLGGTLSVACGLMTKGPVALLVPLFCYGADWALKRKWGMLFSPRHLLDLALIALFLLPMCIGLYQQFDLHPEKIVNGKRGVSGLKFFFWTQSFGRITGENEWNNGAGFEFLLSNMLWSFLPWIFLFLPALVLNIRELAQQRFRLREDQEWITTGGFVLTYVSLALSRYQLPHYIFVVFPLAAIMSAKLLRQFILGKKYAGLYRVLRAVLPAVTFLLFIGLLLILVFTFPAGWAGITCWLLAVAGWIGYCVYKRKRGIIIWGPAAGMLLINIFLTHYFYRNLLRYEAGAVIGKFIRHSLPDKQVFAYKVADPLVALHFYAQRVIPGSQEHFQAGSGTYVLTQPEHLPEIEHRGFSFDLIRQGAFFKVSELTPEFLNEKSRHRAVRQYCLIYLR